MDAPAHHDRSALAGVARRAMVERGLRPEFEPAALEQAARLAPPIAGPDVRDLRELLWCSIDNEDSRDLDQLSVSEELGDGRVRTLIAIADVDALVAPGTPIDAHAATNTTSVYTAARVFSMLPERISTDLTSLNPGVDRLAVVVAYVVGPDGALDGTPELYRALVFNHAKLAYDRVAAWLDGTEPLPAAAARVPGLDADLRRQDEVATRLRRARYADGALDFESLEARPVFDGDTLVRLRPEAPNRAKRMIADFMIAANGVVARFLEARQRPSLRRVVRAPDRWAKIVAVAAEHGETLPATVDAAALGAFLARRRAADPLRFPDLSLVIVKLMGRGEYAVDLPGGEDLGHFGLAAKDYSHSTAPNRRFPDLVTQRLLKAALADAPAPYDATALAAIAAHCSLQESNASKVERQVKKSAAALVLARRIGDRFAGVVTGASDKGTYVRIFDPAVEGRVMRGERGLRVGDKVDVELVRTDFERGYLDFAVDASRPRDQPNRPSR